MLMAFGKIMNYDSRSLRSSKQFLQAEALYDVGNDKSFHHIISNPIIGFTDVDLMYKRQ